MSDTTQTTSTLDNISHVGVSWTCHCCRLQFDHGGEQRTHMKNPWQYVCLENMIITIDRSSVYNLKRRIASLPPISRDVFEAQVWPRPQPEDEATSSITEHTQRDTASPHRCLFCHEHFDDADQGLENNLRHMSTIHGFIVPDTDRVLDLGAFLSYLSTVVREWNECLHCGVIRDSTLATQSHMRDKQHCKLNLAREPELLEFWEESSEAEVIMPIQSSNTSLVLASGRTVASRPARSQGSRVSETSLVHRSNAMPSTPGLQISRRDAMGMQNVGPQQRHALVVALKRSQKDAAMASQTAAWSTARKSNKQKYDQDHGPLSWAKGGLHNLLPR